MKLTLLAILAIANVILPVTMLFSDNKYYIGFACALGLANMIWAYGILIFL